MTKKLYIQTIGCQMNVYDSERIAKGLKPSGYNQNSSLKEADMVIVNTCAIREKAEQKVFSFLGRLAEMKKHRPRLIIGVGGCVAQQEGKKILERVPMVDFVFGTHAIARLPEIVERVESKKLRIVDINMSEQTDSLEFATGAQDSGSISKFVTIMQGCDNYCTYCVVPYVRGRETSRSPENIIKEIRDIVKSGVREVTLLGQNVNSYGIKEGMCSFPELLSMINDVDGLFRIRFTTSHPKDLSDELIMAFKNTDKLCRHIHLPVQSGSDRILKKMNRKYTKKIYLEKIGKLRSICLEIAISSDFIAGFPGETQADFNDTMDLIKTVEYDSVFAFKYSDRPNAPAARFSDKVPEQEKKERLEKILALQEHYTNKKNHDMVGTNQQILAEGLSKKQPDEKPEQWTGRTSANKIVNFARDNDLVSRKDDITGKLLNIRIEEAFSHSLRGRIIADSQ
ncbi:MAG: tRNA (N6-isopentenyl adenosine(37)-C2)-methylthiotransferase MiaB [Desulfobacteraceae bacterium]|nr:tRNA (N6-isopentenyl adenosine(37)-C2)-methylthiotransferase MiaB [Desulfobacteraceae bacterium]